MHHERTLPGQHSVCADGERDHRVGELVGDPDQVAIDHEVARPSATGANRTQRRQRRAVFAHASEAADFSPFGCRVRSDVKKFASVHAGLNW